MGNILVILLPLLALLLAAISVAALYYWWTSGHEDSEGSDAYQTRDFQPQEYKISEPTVGELVGKVTTSAQSWLSNIAKTAATPTSSAANSSGYAHASDMTPISDGETVEVLRVLRDLADGGLVVEIGGRRYRGLDEIIDPQVKRRFMGNAQALSLFAQVDMVPKMDLTPASSEAGVQPPSSSPVMGTSSVPVHPAKPIAIPDAKEEGDTPKTIADEIEEMIQYRLLVTPSLMGRSIHIRSAAGGGIRVEVDGHGFSSVSDVPDPEVLAFLQSVIHEWEERS